VRIQKKLFLALFITSIIAVALLVTAMQWSMRNGVVDYLNQKSMERLTPLANDLAERYQHYQGWEWIQDKPFLFKKMLHENAVLTKKQSRRCEGDDCKKSKHDFIPFKLIDVALFDQYENLLVSVNYHAKKRLIYPVVLDGEHIAYLSIPNNKKITKGIEFVFLQQQKKVIWLVSLSVLLLAAIIAYLLARHFVRPIEQLTGAANDLTQGDYQRRLEVNRNDELGQLARDVNELAITLENNEGSRKRWLADISHELRTPLSILAGEVEAMLDGVRPLSKTGIASMKEEIDHLSQLVNDLYELTRADIGGLSYRKSDVNLVSIIANKISQFTPQFEEKGLAVSAHYEQDDIEIKADATRLNQLLDNIFTNAIRYTYENGQVAISVLTEGDDVSLVIEDSLPSVSEEALAHLFDHLYRTEQSRNRETGGSGLGLAICKRIVEAHSGTISAHQSRLGGVAIHIRLPR
jgi:two-component system sensor histidine kinase BaeS